MLSRDLLPAKGREPQLAELAAVVGLDPTADAAPSHDAPREPPPPLVVVYGGVSTGKSRCVRSALRASADHFAFVDCTGVMTTRAFYREVLGQLHDNARGRRVRRDDSNAASEANDVDVEDVTITDAPVPAFAETMETEAEADADSQETTRKKTTQQRKGSAESDSDAESDASDDPLATAAPRATDDSARDDPSLLSLNFLSFVKALRIHMDTSLPQDTTAVCGPKPTVFIALDHAETLLNGGFQTLLTCLLAVNDQLDYLHVLDEHGAPWRLCLILVVRAISLDLDLFLHGAHPAFIHFPPYTKEQVAAIVTQNLLGAADLSVALDDNRERAAWLRKWLVSIYDLLPHCHNDWLEFQHVVVQLLPSFHAFFDLVSASDHAPLPQLVDPAAGRDNAATDGTNHSWKQLQKASSDRIRALEKSRRRHLFGYDNVSVLTSAAEVVPVSSGDPVAFITSSKLSRSCLLLLVASYLASFTPHEADAHFASSSGGVKRKRRFRRASGEGGNGANGAPGGATAGQKKTAAAASARKALNQQLVGPKIFELPRLLAIYLSLQIESDAMVDEAAASNDLQHDTKRDYDKTTWTVQHGDPSTRTRADIFTHLALLVRLRLLQRASPPSDLDQPTFRCIADTRLVQEIARRLQFPLDSYLNTRG